MNPARTADAQRRADLARIHILKAELKLDRDQYEAVLWTVGQVESARDLDDAGRRALIQHLEARRQHAGRAALAADPQRPNNVDSRPQLGKIEAQLAAGGRTWAYALGMARKMYGKDRVEFASGEELAGIIAALHQDARRHGRQAR